MSCADKDCDDDTFLSEPVPEAARVSRPTMPIESVETNSQQAQSQQAQSQQAQSQQALQNNKHGLGQQAQSQQTIFTSCFVPLTPAFRPPKHIFFFLTNSFVFLAGRHKLNLEYEHVIHMLVCFFS